MFSGELDEGPSRLALHVGRVHHREPGLRQATAGDEAQHRERVGVGALVVLVVGDQPAADVRGDHLRRPEVPARERALARTRRSDQQHEAGIGEVDPHRVKTAIWVGGLTTASSGPTGSNRIEYPYASATFCAHDPNSARVHSNR